MGAARLAGDVRLFEPEPRFVCAGCGNAEPMSDAISQVARRNLPTSSGRNFPKAATAPALGKNWSRTLLHGDFRTCGDRGQVRKFSKNAPRRKAFLIWQLELRKTKGRRRRANMVPAARAATLRTIGAVASPSTPLKGRGSSQLLQGNQPYSS
jgi:hypothetical protein